MANVLLIGSGAREHAIAEAVVKSGSSLYCVASSNNPGIFKLSNNMILTGVTDTNIILDYAKDKKIDLAIIGPEAPLAAGTVDILESSGIRCIGPTKEAAQVETNKYFLRSLMSRHKTDGLVKSDLFEDSRMMTEFIESFDGDVVIKPLGLTGGKGVKIVDRQLEGQLKDKEEAKTYGRKVIEDNMGGFTKVLVEEKLDGEEFTLQTFVDGSHVVGMPLVQDHKFAFIGDNGPFTGGMGSYSDSSHVLPFMTADEYEKAFKIIQQIVNALKKDGIEYRGVLYGQFMLTKDGPKIVEVNARFGDPEAMNVLPLLETDFLEICYAIVDRRLNGIKISFEKKATVCKYAVPYGYPSNPIKNQKISVGALPKNSRVYYASVDQRPEGLFMGSSRAVACLGIGETIEDAEKTAELAMQAIHGPIHYRPDIGTRELIDKRIKHMSEIRGTGL